MCLAKAILCIMYSKSLFYAISFFVSFCPSVLTEKLGSYLTDLHEIWYLSIFRKCVEEIQVSLKSDKNNGHFTWRPVYISYNISLISS
jgi:hypothetical protein